jgi:uncharacterized protein
VAELLILLPAAATGRRCGPIELLVIQSTSFCNIDCRYCYLHGRSDRRVMAQETITQLFEDLLSGPFCGDHLTVVWHAGEPLVPGVDFYEQAFAMIRRLNSGRVDVTQSFQTNGTLLTQCWVDFFRRHEVSLGISLDGPKWLHDAHRRNRQGGGTFDKTIAAVRLLQANRFPFHVIAVLTSVSLSAADEIFRFFVDNGIVDVGFNIEECEGANKSSSLRDTPYEHARCFFERIASLCARSGTALRIRELAGAANAILYPDSFLYGNPQTEALRIVTVAVDGGLSTFSPELIGSDSAEYGNFRFGSVYNGGISAMLSDRYFIQVEREITSGVDLCRKTCEYFEVCLGGAPANKYFENSDLASSETMFCRLSKKAIVDVVLTALENESKGV